MIAASFDHDTGMSLVDEMINKKTILVIFKLHNEEKLMLKKLRLSLIKLSDVNIKAKNT